MLLLLLFIIIICIWIYECLPLLSSQQFYGAKVKKTISSCPRRWRRLWWLRMPSHHNEPQHTPPHRQRHTHGHIHIAVEPKVSQVAQRRLGSNVAAFIFGAFEYLHSIWFTTVANIEILSIRCLIWLSLWHQGCRNDWSNWNPRHVQYDRSHNILSIT